MGASALSVQNPLQRNSGKFCPIRQQRGSFGPKPFLARRADTSRFSFHQFHLVVMESNTSQATRNADHPESRGPAIGMPVHNTVIPESDYDHVDPVVMLGEQGVQQDMVNKQGLRLKSYFWPAADAKAVLLFVHGHGAHMPFELLKSTGLGKAPQYKGSWVEQMNQAGISLCGLDNQGCGRSEGLHGLRFYVNSFDDYVDDVIQLARSLDDSSVPGFQGLPRFIGGLSLGGCITYNTMLKEKSLFRGAVMLAPMLSLEKVSRKGINPYIRPISTLLNWLWPAGEIVATDRNTLYPDIQDEWDNDPLTMHGKTRVRNANEYLRVSEEVMKSLDKADFPFILFHSENDTMCDCDGSKQLYLQSPSADKQLRLVNHMWHVMMREEGNEKVLQEICQWVLDRS